MESAPIQIKYKNYINQVESINHLMDELEKRKEEVLGKLKKITEKPTYLIYTILGVIIAVGIYIRTRNLGIIQWQFPVDPDSYAFLRYAKYVAENGHLMDIDMLRYYPLGWTNLSEFRVLSYFIAYLYKLIHIFIPSITIENVDVIYPVITFAVGAIFFFLFVKKLFNWKIGLVSTAFLVVVPAYLYRTMAGSADKEAFATMVMFAALYFFISAWNSDSIKNTVVFGILSGVFTALTGLVWGGVLFLFLTIATFTLINLLLGKLNKKTTITYVLWFLVTVLVLNQLYPERFYFLNFISNIQLTAMILVFFSVITLHIINQRDKLKQKISNLTKDKIPLEITSVLIVLLAGIAAITIIKGTGSIIYQLEGAYVQLTEPFGTNRWVLTVAEAHLPSFSDWLGQFSLRYLLITLAGATLAFYGMIKGFNKRAKATALFSLSMIAISISRYNPSSILNGSNMLSLTVYFGLGLCVLLLLFLYPYVRSVLKKDTNTLELLKGTNSNILFAIIFLVYLMISAKTAIRLLFIFAPATAIFAGYFTIGSLKRIKAISNDTYKIIGYAIVIVLVSLTLLGFFQATLNQARYTGSSYTYQWQQAMNWVRENTPKDAVFAHWWDYGYYVQTGGERATLSDGGNSRGAINYFTGRHLLTGQSETEALELLKANNATHFLVVYEEIGKYPAFSSIGSDIYYDRYSWISTFTLDPSQIQETRNETVLVYRGGTANDEDFIYQDRIYPGGGAGIGAVLIPVTTENYNETKTRQKMNQPSVIMVYQGQQVKVPLECIFLDGKEITYPEKGYPGCFRMVPTVEADNRMNQMGAGLLLSPKVRRTVFTKLYLYDSPSEHFKKVYTDADKGMPLVIYQGRLIGPLNIWEISYPDNLTIPPEYYGTEEPEGVDKVGKRFN